MRGHEHGVTWYTSGTAVITAYFPEDKVTCSNCRYITRRHGLRYECLLTDEILLYPDEGRGNVCPIEMEDEKNEDQ